jgi:PTS system cellobiose-specific IIC component
MSPSWAASRPSSGGSDDGLSRTGLVARLERAAAAAAQRVAGSPAVRALHGALPLAFAVALAALVCRLAAAVVIPPFAGWAAALKDVAGFVPAAFSIASAALVVVLGVRLARELAIPAAALVAASVAAFGLALPRGAFVSFGTLTRTLGVSGVFTAILVVLATAGAIVAARRRLGDAAGVAAGGGAVVAVCAVLFAAGASPASVLASALAPLGTLGDSFAALAAITVVESLLWIVGIHGPALLAAIVFPVYLDLQLRNTAAFAHHAPVQHIVAAATFLFVFPGGCGATLPLVVLLLRSRVRRLRALAYAALGPALLNVNEPLVFGVPVAYNPVLAVPFVAAPLALACTTYAAMASGIVGRPLFYVPSAVPAIANAFVATLDWRACVLQVVNLAVAAVIWFPFVRAFERAEAARDAVARSAA